MSKRDSLNNINAFVINHQVSEKPNHSTSDVPENLWFHNRHEQCPILVDRLIIAPGRLIHSPDAIFKMRSTALTGNYLNNIQLWP